MVTKRLAPVVLSLIFATHCATTVPGPKPAAIPLDPEIRRGVLDNGLTYYIRVNRKPEKRAELRLAINAGSVLESEEQRGLAHFVEHMAFNGTKNFEKQELVNYLERVGMRFGPDINAYTSFDETVYMLQVPTDDPKIIATAFQILHDWAGAVSFEDSEIDKERGVVIEEWRLGRNAAGRIRDKQFPLLFHGSQYANRLPIGIKKTLETAPPERLRQFYRDWYRPDLAAVVAVGDFDPDRIEALIREHFSDLENARRPPPRKEYSIPDHAETLVSVVSDPEATSLSVQVQYKRPPVKQETIADLRESLIDNLYHGMMNARLRELGRAADPPYQFAYAGSGGLGRTKSSYILTAQVRNGGVERGLVTLLTEARRVEQHGFTETELQRAKLNALRSIDRAFEERDKQESARFASQYVRHFLEEDPAPSMEWTRNLYHELIPGVGLAEINARADQWVSDTNRVILVSGPDKKEAGLPDEEQLLAMFRDTEQLAVTPWVDRVRDEPLIAQSPPPGTIVEEKQFPDVGVTRWKLSNGAIILIKPTDFKNDEILIRGWSPGGYSLASDATHLTATRTSEIVAQMGLGKFDSIELGKALTGKIAFVGPYVSELTEGVRGSASPQDLETAFQMLHLRFAPPRRDEQAFASFLSTTRGRLENQWASPPYLLSQAINEVLTQDHPWRRFLTVEQVEQMKLEQALTFYEQRFADASDFIFTIVGNVDLGALRPLVEKWIASLPSLNRVETWRDIGGHAPDGAHKVEVVKGIEPRSTVRIVFQGPATWSLEESHQHASLREILRIRLREELREDRGGVYGVGVTGSVWRYPTAQHNIIISFNADPERVDELVKGVFDEIEKLSAEGPTEDHLNRVREIQRRGRETSLKQNGFWSDQLEYMATNNLEFTEILRHDARINAVTRDSVRDAARKYLDQKRYVIGILNPEKP